MRRWRVEFVDWHGNVQVIRLCLTKWGASRLARRYSNHLWSGATYVRIDAEWEWAEW